MLKKLLSFGLALALFVTSPASVFAVDAEAPTVEAAAENNEEGTQDEPVVTSEGENLKSDTLPAGEEQASESQSGSEDISGEDELNNGRAGSTDLGLEKAEGENEEAENADELAETEADDANACEHAEFEYESNGDGTHKKICKDCDEVVAEAEPCEFDENGKCVLCGYEKNVDLIYESSDIKVIVSGTASALNGATKVDASKIEGERLNQIGQTLQDNAESEGEELVAFVAYDISLRNDANDNIEPADNEKVSVKIEKVKTPKQVDVDSTTVGIDHFEGEGNTSNPTDITEEATTSYGDDVSTIAVEFETESFSEFSIKWTTVKDPTDVGFIDWRDSDITLTNWSYDTYRARFYVVDEKGNGIKNVNGNIALNINSRWHGNTVRNESNLGDISGVQADSKGDYFKGLVDKFGISIEGYEYDSAHFISRDDKNIEITNLSYNDGAGGWCYYGGGWDGLVQKGGTRYTSPISIYLVFTKGNEPDTYFTANLFKYNAWNVNYANYLAHENSSEANKGTLYFRAGASSASGISGRDGINYSDDNAAWNTCNGINATVSDPKKPAAYQGIVKDVLENNLPVFNYVNAGIFDPNSEIFKSNDVGTKAYKDVLVPFYKDEDGYYVLDANEKYNNKYNMYLFDGDKTMIRKQVDEKQGFWPFAKENDYGKSAHHFGMDLQVYFKINEDGQLVDKNGAKKDIKFEFAGDDDVWVFINGHLALDLGGVHQVVNGSINFKDGWCTVNDAYVSGTSSDNYKTKESRKNLYTEILGYKNAEEGRKALSNGASLQIFYLERGSEQSNCKLKFNFTDTSIVTPTDVYFTKTGEGGRALKDAEFALYDGNDTKCEGERVYSEKSGDDGKVLFKNVKAGTYWLKETKAPEPYVLNENIYKVTVQNGVSTIENGKKKQEEPGSFSIVDTETNKTVDTIANYIQTEEINDPDVDKKATLVDWKDRTYEIELDATATKTIKGSEPKAVDVVLVLDTSGSMYFPKTLTKAKYGKLNNLNGSGPYYFVNDTAVYVAKKFSGTWYYKKANNYYQNPDGPGYYTNGWNTFGGFNLGNDNRQYYSSNGETRLSDLQNAARNFVDEIAKSNQNSRVAIVEFSGETETVMDLTKLDNRGVSNLKNAINSLSANNGSGTNQYLGLQQGTGLLKDDKDNAIVLITDGVREISPYYPDNTNHEKVVSNAQNQATVYAIGMNLSYSDSVRKEADDLLKELASQGKDGEELFKNIGDESLNLFLKDIAGEITKEKTVGLPSVVTDVIDPRFELVANQQVTGEYLDKDGKKRTAQVIVKGNTITWDIPSTDGFVAKFKVKAKDDFFGGNVITTNSSAQLKVKVEGKPDIDKTFPKPTVNVKLLDLSLTDEETTVLLGDEFDQAEVSDKIAFIKGLTATYTDSKNVSHTVTGVFTDNSISVDANGKISYKYPGTNDFVGTVELTSVPNTSTSSLGDNVYKYTNTVTYTPIKYEDRSKEGVAEPTHTDKANEPVVAIGEYKVNVVDAAIKASKVGGATESLLNGAEYKLYDSQNNELATVTSVTLNGADGQMLFEGLGVGTYTIKESAAPAGYALSDEVFTVTITADESVASQYKLTITSSTNKSDVIDEITFSVLKDGAEGGYLFDDNAKKITENNSTKLIENTTTVVIKTANAAIKAIDTVAYRLPETGGRGVYVYTVGGVLLMLGACLLLYKNKKNKNK